MNARLLECRHLLRTVSTVAARNNRQDIANLFAEIEALSHTCATDREALRVIRSAMRPVFGGYGSVADTVFNRSTDPTGADNHAFHTTLERIPRLSSRYHLDLKERLQALFSAK